MCSSISGWQAAATTNSLCHVMSRDTCSREKGEAEYRHLHMAWALAGDKQGDPGPRMPWSVD
jgi:hypothetical protein